MFAGQRRAGLLDLMQAQMALDEDEDTQPPDVPLEPGLPALEESEDDVTQGQGDAQQG